MSFINLDDPVFLVGLAVLAMIAMYFLSSSYRLKEEKNETEIAGTRYDRTVHQQNTKFAKTSTIPVDIAREVTRAEELERIRLER